MVWDHLNWQCCLIWPIIAGSGALLWPNEADSVAGLQPLLIGSSNAGLKPITTGDCAGLEPCEADRGAELFLNTFLRTAVRCICSQSSTTASSMWLTFSTSSTYMWLQFSNTASFLKLNWGSIGLLNLVFGFRELPSFIYKNFDFFRVPFGDGFGGWLDGWSSPAYNPTT